MLTNTPTLAELIDSRILELRREGTVTAKEIAMRAGIKETTLSMIRKGHRGVSQEMALKVAGALQLDRNRIQQVLTAAGYGPVALERSVMPVVEHLNTKDGFIDILRSVSSGASIWQFGLGLLETIDDAFLGAFLENYKRSVRYKYFLSQRNALDFVKLRDLLQSDGLKLTDKCCAVVLPDESFHHRDAWAIKCLLKESHGVRGFESKDFEGRRLFRELGSSEVVDLQSYLEQLEQKAHRQEAGLLPNMVTEWLHRKGYSIL